MKNIKFRLFALIAVLMLAMPATGTHAVLAQGNSQTFPETGKTVSGTFLTYWQTHGGLAQQGYPITEQIQEVSDTDGKTYTVQYFERAVFELHPEFAGTPNEVLLSLLGVFLYHQKYPNGAPGQAPSTAPDARVFPETGHKVGGKFLAYWNTHGALAQQGFPISDEFQEVSDLDGKTYNVQYFERAVFELHPEFVGTPNEVLLSQLGTFRLRQKQTPPPATPAPAQPTPTTAPVQPTTPPPPPPPPPPPATNTPVPQGPCDNVPGSGPDVLIQPSNCERAGTLFSFTARGFQPGEKVGAYITAPDQSVFGAPFQLDTDDAGYIDGGVTFQTQANFPLGIWALTFEGVDSHTKRIAYFKLH